MADTLDRPELKAIVLLDVARDLSVGLPWSPEVSDGPSELSNPLLGAPGWDCPIGVTRVKHNLDLVAQYGVNPVGCFVLDVIVELARALFPHSNFIGDVHCLAHISPVHIISQEVAVSRAVVCNVLGPRSVLTLSHAALIEVNLPVDLGLSVSIPFALESGTMVNWSVEVVPIKL